MANEESGRPLRRRRPFYGAFGAIDNAIEAATGHPRSAFRDMRVRIVVLLRGAAHDDDGGVAEQLCAALDDAMVEALQTLRVAAPGVPAPHRQHSALQASTTDLARAVGALAGSHGSPRIRRLADDVVRGWTAAEHLGEPSVSGDRVPRRQGVSTVVADGNARESVVPAAAAKVPPAKMLPTAAAAAAAVEVHKKKLYIPPAKLRPTATATATGERKKKLYLPPAKMIPTTAAMSEAKKPIVAQSEKMDEANKKPVVAQSEKMETTKRKLREGYQEADRIKRQHTIQKINDKDAAKMFVQKQRQMHPTVRGRRPAACRTSSGVRRSLLPSLQMI